MLCSLFAELMLFCCLELALFRQATDIATSGDIPLWGTQSVEDRKVCRVGECDNPGVECPAMNPRGERVGRSA